MTTNILGQRNTKQKSSTSLRVDQQPLMSSMPSSTSLCVSGYNIVKEEPNILVPVTAGHNSNNSTAIGTSNHHQRHESSPREISSSSPAFSAITSIKVTPSTKMMATSMTQQTKYSPPSWSIFNSVTACSSVNRGTTTVRNSCTTCFMAIAILFSICIFVSMMYVVNQYDDILGQYTVRKTPMLQRHEPQQSQQYYLYQDKEDEKTSSWHAAAVPSYNTVQDSTFFPSVSKTGRNRDRPKEQEESQHQQHVDHDLTVAPNHIKAISILGERNSGTTWMYEHLGECFNHSIPVKRRLTRYKHWFQDESVRTAPIVNDTLVIAMFRNPFEWIEAMRKRPHHASQHIFLGWKEFVTKPWTMDRVGLDLEMSQDQQDDPDVCQEGFRFRDIVTCHQRPYSEDYFHVTHYSNHQPFYEMRNDGSGKPFGNILELRSAKNRNFLSTIDYYFVKELWIVRYEDMLRGGTSELIRDIVAASGDGIRAKCAPSPPQRRQKRSIGSDEMKYLLEHVDWQSEMDIGYTRAGMRKAKNNSTIYRKIT